MSFDKKYDENLAQEIRKIVIEKQLNILIGSGCFSYSMPLMSGYDGVNLNERNHMMNREIIPDKRDDFFADYPEFILGISSNQVADVNKNKKEEIHVRNVV